MLLSGGETVHQYGTIQIRVKEQVAKSGISRRKVRQRAGLQRGQMNRYWDNAITRLDKTVLARLCTVLQCEVGDLLEFVLPEEQ